MININYNNIIIALMALMELMALMALIALIALIASMNKLKFYLNLKKLNIWLTAPKRATPVN